MGWYPGKNVENWLYARDMAPGVDPGVVARRKAYGDVQRNFIERTLAGQSNLSRTAAGVGAGMPMSSSYQRGMNQISNLAGIDWQTDITDAMERAKAKQTLESRMRQGQAAAWTAFLIEKLGSKALGFLFPQYNLAQTFGNMDLNTPMPGSTPSNMTFDIPMMF